MYQLVQIDRSTDPPTETVQDATCFFEDPPATGETPPAPPSTEEIREIAIERIDPPQLHTNPSPQQGGIAGLENWFWYEGPEQVTARSSVRGYTVTATMHPTHFVWEPCAEFQATSDNDSGQALNCPVKLSSDEPGSEPSNQGEGQAAAARWTYETDGRYVIRHEVVWQGDWTFSGHGTTSSGSLSTVRTTGETDYRVNEVRSRLTTR